MFIGRLTRDVELRVTPKGTAIAQFGVAINRKFKSESGESKEEVVFLDVEAWGKTGELMSKYTQKGSEIFGESRLKLDQWEDKQSGQKRSKLKVVLENVQFLSSGREGGQSEGYQEDASQGHPPEQQRRGSMPAPGPGGMAYDPNGPDDSDVPF